VVCNGGKWRIVGYYASIEGGRNPLAEKPPTPNLPNLISCKPFKRIIPSNLLFVKPL